MNLRSIEIINQINEHEYPYNLPLIKSFESIEFKSPVTILVGENGTGKSTLLEAIAASVGSITLARESVDIGEEFKGARNLAKNLKLTWKSRSKKGFFLKSQDFINYINNIEKMRREAKERLEEIDIEYKDKSIFSKNLAKMPHAGTLNDIKSLYGNGLHLKSHGEGYIELFHSRFIPGGLYILDEPETPLSPMRQLGFISMIKDMVNDNSQFIIATHSPIIMAYPGATIISLDELPIKEVNYNDLEHVNLTRSFLNDPDSYLRYL